MALTLAKCDTAHYVHASLEQFDTVAVREITRIFHMHAATASEQEPLSLSYDERNHVFTLIHHNRMGSQLDEALGRIIRNYVAGEAAAVTRFAEGAFGDYFEQQDDDDFELELEVEQSATPASASLVSTVHLVNFDGMGTHSKAKAFGIGDLPLDLRNRVRSRHDVSHLSAAISLRRVRWDESTQEHVFDGSVGQLLSKLSTTELEDLEDLFALLSFSSFVYRGKIPLPSREENDAKHWEFVNDQPGIGQWLEGMGETRLVDPDAQPEMGAEEFKFARGRSLQDDSIGRVRKPRGIPLAEHQLPQSNMEPDRPEADTTGDFLALLQSKGKDNSGSDSQSSESDSEEEDIFAVPKPAKVAELVQVNSAVPAGGAPALSTPAPTAGQRQNLPTSMNTAATTTLSSGPLMTRSRVATTPMTQATSRSEANFPNHGRSYVVTDRWGLAGNPASQVAWENENAAPFTSHQTRRAPLTYDELRSERAQSVSMSISAGRHARPQPVTNVTPMSYGETALGGNEPWARNVVPPTVFVPTGVLVSTDGSVTSTVRPQAPRFPPGLFPPLGSSEPPSRRSQIEPPPGITTATNIRSVPAGGLRPQTKPASQTLAQEMSVESTAPLEEALISFGDDDDPVIERLKAQDDNVPRLHRTMRQQASKHKQQQKKGKAKASGSRPAPSRPAVLELPSPPPPPKAKPSPDFRATKPKTQSPAKFNANDLETMENQSSSRFEESVDGLSFHQDLTEVVVDFGIALMTKAEDLLANKASRCADLQEELDQLTAKHRSTNFQQVLGREQADGVYLLRLPTTLLGSVSPHVGESRLVETYFGDEPHCFQDMRLYEINIVVPGGREWTLVFDHEDPESVEITPTHDDQQSIYVHYPQRVWDARIRPGHATPAKGFPNLDRDLKRRIMTFLKTLNTLEEARDTGLPDFEAFIPDKAFVVTNVFAKRVLTRILTRGSWKVGSWAVTQVLDLHLRPPAPGSMGAFAQDEGTMQRQGRLWWEAALRYDGLDGLDGLEDTISEIVAKLDPVGVVEVPAKKVKPGKGKKPKEEGHIPYW